MKTVEKVPAGRANEPERKIINTAALTAEIMKLVNSQNGKELQNSGVTKPRKKMGWQRDLPDFRDYTTSQTKLDPKQISKGIDTPVGSLVNKVKAKASSLPTSVDLRPWFSPIEDQGNVGSCTANAGVGLLEYFENRAFGNHLDASRLFLYKATRNLLQWEGDTGAYLRSTMGAMALFGVPPENYWPYDESKYDAEPPAFCYAFAQNYQSIQYFRLDPPGMDPADLLKEIKKCIAGGIPSMFGFTVYSSISQGDSNGHIPMPAPREKVEGGHAVVAAGYDDNMIIQNTNNNGPKTKGAFIVRNSWGTGYGDNGYYYLPYDYVLSGLAVDWWSLIKSEWIATGEFGE